MLEPWKQQLEYNRLKSHNRNVLRKQKVILEHLKGDTMLSEPILSDYQAHPSPGGHALPNLIPNN